MVFNKKKFRIHVSDLWYLSGWQMSYGGKYPGDIYPIYPKTIETVQKRLTRMQNKLDKQKTFSEN